MSNQPDANVNGWLKTNWLVLSAVVVGTLGVARIQWQVTTAELTNTKQDASIERLEGIAQQQATTQALMEQWVANHEKNHKGGN